MFKKYVFFGFFAVILVFSSYSLKENDNSGVIINLSEDGKTGSNWEYFLNEDLVKVSLDQKIAEKGSNTYSHIFKIYGVNPGKSKITFNYYVLENNKKTLKETRIYYLDVSKDLKVNIEKQEVYYIY